MSISERVAARYIQAQWVKEAKPKYLKALDFTAGLIKRLTAQGKRLPGNSNAEVLRRIFEMRSLVQSDGIDLTTIVQNKKAISGAGKVILEKLEAEEADLLPSDKDLAPFVKAFPNQADTAATAQGKYLLGIISQATKVADVVEIKQRLMTDRDFFDDAFKACRVEVNGMRAGIVSSLGGKIAGHFEERAKQAESCFGKQSRDNKPFVFFKDLVGCRTVVPTVRELAVGSSVAQSQFNVLDKKNYFLKAEGTYNAINYNLGAGWLVFEFQLKTDVNAIEAALSHDLIYAQEKAITKLTNEEKHLVAVVIDVSTQLSMKEWADTFELAVKTAAIRQAITRSRLRA